MKNKSKRLFTLFLSLFLLTSIILAACIESVDTDSKDTASQEAKSLVPHLERRSFAGKTITILATLEDDVYGDVQIAPTEHMGEPVNDAFYDRNSALEAEYGFKIEALYTAPFAPFTDRVRNDIFADTVEYDAVSAGLMDLAPLVTDGLLINLAEIEGSYLSLDEDWWDPPTIKDMSIANKIFFVTGDIFVLDDENTIVTYFNKDLIEDNNLESPYDLVYSGDWTIDKMHEMAKAVATDDGDGVMNVTGNDIWGLVGGSFESYHYTVGCNSPLVQKDNDDLPYLTMTDEDSLNAFSKVYDMYTDRSCTAYIEQYYAWNDPDAPKVTDNFYSGRSLFFAAFMFLVNNPKMRETKVRYGIVPHPKYNKEQEHYYSTINPYRFYCLSLTDSGQDLDFVTFALEAMAYLGRERVTPEYYNRTLQLKRFDDSESPEMLDIIFSNRIVDLAIVYNWADCIQWYNRVLSSGSNSVVSLVESMREAFEREKESTINAILANN